MTTWYRAVQAVTFLAFLVGAVSANLAILFSKEREKLCATASAEKLMDHFLLGVSYFSLAFNVTGFLITLVSAIPKLDLVARLKPVLWVLKDILLGLLVTAAVITLLSALDLRKESACEFTPRGKALLALTSLALIFAVLYIVFRVLMVLWRP